MNREISKSTEQPPSDWDQYGLPEPQADDPNYNKSEKIFNFISGFIDGLNELEKNMVKERLQRIKSYAKDKGYTPNYLSMDGARGGSGSFSLAYYCSGEIIPLITINFGSETNSKDTGGTYSLNPSNNDKTVYVTYHSFDKKNNKSSKKEYKLNPERGKEDEEKTNEFLDFLKSRN